MNKFKIGDKVRVINNNQGYSEDFTGVDVEPNSDGWIDWDGSDKFPPNVNFNDKIEVMFWNGETNNKNTVDWWEWKINSNTGYSIKKYRLVKCEKQPEEVSSKTKSDGGSSDYYKLEINGNPVEVEDVIYAMVGGDFALGNALKALRRMYLDSKGQGKEGIDMQYDANKIKYFVDSYVKRFGVNNE